MSSAQKVQKRLRFSRRRALAPATVIALLAAGLTGFGVASPAAADPPGADAFVSTWDTSVMSPDAGGESDDRTIRLPLWEDNPGAGIDTTYDFVVDWGDGSSDHVTAFDAASHTYASPGTYTVSITGTIIGFSFMDWGDRLKIQDISQWGPLAFGNIGYYFQGAENLTVSASDAPDLTGTTNLAGTFERALDFNSPIDHWDTSEVEIFDNMFAGASQFDQPMSDVDTESATEMNGMFTNAASFNSAMVSTEGGWDTNGVVGMQAMFSGSAEFDQDISSWDVSTVENMSAMFAVSNYNQPLDEWNTASLKNLSNMFLGTASFDQDISSWDIADVIDMSDMFADAGLSVGNYSKLLVGWGAQEVQPNVPFNAGTSTYYAGPPTAARDDVLRGDNGWDIADSGQSPLPGFTPSVVATAGYQKVIVSWGAAPVPATTGSHPNPAVTAYSVVAYVDGVPVSGGVCDTTSALTCTISGLTNGTAYTFTVVATNAAGAGPASVSGPATPQVIAPVNTAPPLLSGTPTSGQTLSVTDGTWTADPSSLTYSYQWQTCSTSDCSGTVDTISGSTNQLVLTNDQIGLYVRAVVTASNGSSTSAAAITPTAVVGQTRTVTFSVNGGTGTAPSPESSTYGTSITLPSGTGLSLTNYSFGGWNTSVDGSGTNYAAGASYALPDSDITLYAKWNILQYALSYNGNDNTSGTPPTGGDTDYGATVTVAGAGDLAKTGHTFAGWNTAAHGTGTSYAPAATFAMPAAPVTLYAQWTVNQYALSYNGNDNTSGTPPTGGDTDYGATVTVAGAGDLAKTGHTFAGWNTAANGTGTAYAPAGTFAMPAGAVTLYAQWNINQYTVSYDLNGGVGTTPTQQSGDFNSSITLATNTGITRSGYTFVGWNTLANGTGTNYAAGASYMIGASDVTLYASWSLLPSVSAPVVDQIVGTQLRVTATVEAGGSEVTAVECGIATTDDTNTMSWTTASPATVSTGATENASCTVANLTPETQYFAAVRATNSAGTTTSATTSAATINTPSISTPTVSGITVSSAVIQTTLSARGGTTTGIQCSYSATGVATQTQTAIPAEVPGIATNAPIECNLTGLSHGTTYTVEVIATNAAGTATTAPITLTTQSPTPIPPQIADQCPGGVCVGANLAGRDLTNVNMSGIDLAGANFTGADLANANLTGCNLTGARFGDADLAQANFTGANLTGAIFTERANSRGDLRPKLLSANLNRAVMTRANLTNADLRGVKLSKANLSKVKAKNARFTGAIAKNTKFTAGSFVNADFRRANLTKSSFKKANIAKAKFRHANLTKTSFAKATGKKSAKF